MIATSLRFKLSNDALELRPPALVASPDLGHCECPEIWWTPLEVAQPTCRLPPTLKGILRTWKMTSLKSLEKWSHQ